jgi:hypothetical protein
MSCKFYNRTILIILGILAANFWHVAATKANVYATNIKLNGATTNAAANPGTGATISYILNEPATRGVVVSILAGSNVVRSISVAGGGAGALKGTNSVAWDGKDGNGNNLAGGIYNISITASATGFTNWTRTSTDSNANTGYYVFSPRGMAVNTNPNSTYYGRVFVGNAKNNFSGSAPGDVDGILKLNADGTFADEGQTNGGYNWIDDGFNDSPHYLRYGQDDRIYALDFTGSGVIVALDMAMKTNKVVLNGNNYANNPFVIGPSSFANGWGMIDVTDAGTSKGLLWLGDNDVPNGAGVWVWHMTNGVADPNDTVGTQAIAVGGDLDQLPSGGFMMDENSNIFVSQLLSDFDNASPKTMEFTNWNGMTPLTNGTAWRAGTNDSTFEGVYDTVLNSRANPLYVAYPISQASGGIRVLYASNGIVVTNATGSQTLTNLDGPNQFFGAAWDAVGNLYGASSSLQRWRVYSPPGTNQATTVAVETFTVTAPPVVVFTSITVNNANVTLNFTGPAGDSPSAYTLQSSASPAGSWATVSGASITSPSPGVFQATTTTNGPTLFYRLKR